jgi:hypothetical protein
VSRLRSEELILSYVPEAGQRGWRTGTRTKDQRRRDRVRLQSPREGLLEECPIKLSSVVSDFLGASGQRILRAIVAGETDPARLRGLGDRRSQATDEELRDALNGQPLPLHRKLLTLSGSRSRASQLSTIHGNILVGAPALFSSIQCSWPLNRLSHFWGALHPSPYADFGWDFQKATAGFQRTAFLS